MHWRQAFAVIWIVAFAGCGDAPDDPVPEAKDPCPWPEPANAQQVALRVTAFVAPDYERYGTDRQLYGQGDARLRWDQEWHDEKPLTDKACATFLVTKSVAPLDVFVRVPDKEDPSQACRWSGSQRVADLSGGQREVAVDIRLGCS